MYLLINQFKYLIIAPQTNGSRASESPARETTRGASGLRNIGNTCFMNSVLQPILAAPYLNEYFLKQFGSESKIRTCRIAECYHDLVKQCRGAGGSCITPSAIKTAVSRTGGGASQFTGYG